MTIATLGSRSGSVSTFDAHRGLGVIVDSDGNEFAFHCTGIADGSRQIAEGASVRFDLVAGRLGRWEAWGIEER